MTRPFAFPEREISNSGQTPLPAIVQGSELFAELFGMGLGGGLPMPTEQTALTVSAIFACVSLIAGVIAALPVRIYNVDADGQRTELPNDDLFWILNEQMVPRWSAADGWELASLGMELRGDGFGRLIRARDGTVTGVEPLQWPRVTPIPTRDGKRLIYAIYPDPTIPAGLNETQLEVLDQDDVLHFSGFGFNGVRGMSPLRYWLSMTGSVALSAQEYSARFFSNGARADYALQSDNAIPPEKVAEIYDRLEARHQGPANAHRPMVLTNGLKAQALTLDAEDMALIATRQFQIEEIARAYGIPPFMIGHNEKTTSWGSGVAEMGTGFVRYALRRRLNKIETELNRKLFRKASKAVAFDTTELEKADFTGLVTAFRTALGRAGELPMMTQEEVRHSLGLRREPLFGKLERNPPNANPTPQPEEPAPGKS